MATKKVPDYMEARKDSEKNATNKMEADKAKVGEQLVPAVIKRQNLLHCTDKEDESGKNDKENYTKS